MPLEEGIFADLIQKHLPVFVMTFNAHSEQYFQTFVMCDTNQISLFSWPVYPFSHPFPCSRAPLQSPCRCPDTSPWYQKTHKLSYCHPHFLTIWNISNSRINRHYYLLHMTVNFISLSWSVIYQAASIVITILASYHKRYANIKLWEESNLGYYSTMIIV